MSLFNIYKTTSKKEEKQTNKTQLWPSTETFTPSQFMVSM